MGLLWTQTWDSEEVGEGQETSCFSERTQHLVSGWDACHSCPTPKGGQEKRGRGQQGPHQSPGPSVG